MKTAWVLFASAAMLVSACAPTPSPGASPVSAPTSSLPAPTAVATAAVPATPPATPRSTTSATAFPVPPGSTITWCAITRGDGSTAPTGIPPTTLPVDVTGLIGSADTIVGVFFAPWSNHVTLYAVGQRRASCGVGVGTGFFWWIRWDAEDRFGYEESWSEAPPRWMGCPYLESARGAVLARDGPTVAPSQCVPPANAVITPIQGQAAGLELALVWFEDPAQPGAEAWLFGYRPGGAPGGELGFRAHCPLDHRVPSRCGASLALVADSVGGGRAAFEALLAAFPT